MSSTVPLQLFSLRLRLAFSLRPLEV